MKRVIVIGGGASGLMAAVTSAACGASVTVLEAGKRPGMKLLRTGNGRCNFTNLGGRTGAYNGRDPGFALSVLRRFPPEAVVDFFSGIGILPLDQNGWIYPMSGEAQSVVSALLAEARNRRVKVKTNEKVTEVIRQGAVFIVRTESWSYESDSVILSAGSSASLPDNQSFPLPSLPVPLQSVPFRPALVPLLTRGCPTAEWAGARVHSKAVLYADKEEIGREEGQIQFTKDGISGIPVFDLSGAANLAREKGRHVLICLDLVPSLTEEDIRAYILSADQQIKSDPARLLNAFLPLRLSGALLKMYRGNAEEAASHLKCLPLTVTGSRTLKEAQVAGGGISTEEIDPGTMEVRRCPGLFITGEALDIDARCGGWNLQFAWSSGLLAGKAASMPEE